MKYLKIKEENFIAHVSLNRPAVRNAFHPEMIEELIQIFTDLPQKKPIRVIHFFGEGKVFCAGGDLGWMKEMKAYTQEQNKKDSERLFHMFDMMMRCPLPIVTQVKGAAFGGALGLIACSDFVICENQTQFCFSEVKLGIAPAVISSFVMHKSSLGFVGPWMLTGQVFSAEQALAAGLVHQICDGKSLEEQTAVVLNSFQETGPIAVQKTKALIHQIAKMDWDEKKKESSALIAELRASAEGQEGLSSFLEKRKPSWRLS